MAASGADGFNFVNISTTTANFPLLGGEYGVVVTASFGGGSVTLNALSLDGTTEVAVLPAFTANGYGNVDLPAGQFQFAIVTAGSVYASISRIKKV